MVHSLFPSSTHSSNPPHAQIDELKELLADSGFRGLGKGANKFSVLNGAAEYIRDLQEKNELLQRRRNEGGGSARPPPPHLYEQHEQQIRQQRGGAEPVGSMPSHDPSSKGPGRTGGGGVLATNGMADIDYKHVFLKGQFSVPSRLLGGRSAKASAHSPPASFARPYPFCPLAPVLFLPYHVT